MRRHGLMRPNGLARIVALVLAFGMILGFSSTYLAQAGFGMWAIVVAVLVLVGIPTFLVVRSRSSDDSRGL